MSELHNFGLVRFSKQTGEIDTTMTALGKGLIQYWALQNTNKTQACVIIDINEKKVVSEFVGTADGFPEIRKNTNDFEFNIPMELFDILEEESAKRIAAE